MIKKKIGNVDGNEIDLLERWREREGKKMKEKKRNKNDFFFSREFFLILLRKSL